MKTTPANQILSEVLEELRKMGSKNVVTVRPATDRRGPRFSVTVDALEGKKPEELVQLPLFREE